ncbi:hypothetical protein MTYP_02100 [Methylophilaceae bacterium]|nr:hypothetical protein MTYP_02100 [Methylophilaceae bacterium]
MHRLLLALCGLLIFQHAIAAEGLGRLFTTPAERANLDQLRKTSKAPTTEQETEAEASMVPPNLPSSVSVQGYVKRSDGKKSTVWVNHVPVQENSEAGSVVVGNVPRNGNQVPLRIPATGKNLKLKAGQEYVLETDSVSEIKAGTSQEEDESRE